MKPLDFVVTEDGDFSLILEVAEDNQSAFLEIIDNERSDRKPAWFNKDEFSIIDSLPNLLARVIMPKRNSAETANMFFPID